MLLRLGILGLISAIGVNLYRSRVGKRPQVCACCQSSLRTSGVPLLDDSTAPEAEISAFGPVFVPALLLTPDGLLDGLVLMNPSDCVLA